MSPPNGMLPHTAHRSPHWSTGQGLWSTRARPRSRLWSTRPDRVYDAPRRARGAGGRMVTPPAARPRDAHTPGTLTDWLTKVIE